MAMVDRDCCAQPRGRTLAARTAQRWRALAASLWVVICCFVWLCMRQGHELILKARAERSEGERARTVSGFELAQDHKRVADAATQGESPFAMMSHEIRAPSNAVLGLAMTFLVARLDSQYGQPAAAMPQAGDDRLSLFSDGLDFSRLETDRFEPEQPAFSAASL